MNKLLGTAAIGLAGLGLGLAASALPAAAASGARLDMSKAQIALLLSIGLWTRAATACFSGALTDRFGGRRALRTASIGAAVACLGLGLVFLGGREGSMFVGVAILQALACYFLTFPGPAAAHLNAARLGPAERGRHAGLYGALAFPAEFLALPAGLWLGTRIPHSALLFLPAATALLGLTAALRAPDESGEEGSGPTLAGLLALACRGEVLVLAALEACAGVVRWGLLGWSAQFLSEVHQIRPGVPLFAAALTAVAAGSAAGPALCGLLSDKAFNGRRAPAIMIFFAAQATSLAALGLAKDAGMAVVFLVLACAAAFGVHALLSGAAAMDAGGRRSAGAVCGLLDGVHHAAGGLSLLLIGALLNRGGWGAWTMTMIPFSIAGAATSLALGALRAEVRDPAL